MCCGCGCGCEAVACSSCVVVWKNALFEFAHPREHSSFLPSHVRFSKKKKKHKSHKKKLTREEMGSGGGEAAAGDDAAAGTSTHTVRALASQARWFSGSTVVDNKRRLRYCCLCRTTRLQRRRCFAVLAYAARPTALTALCAALLLPPLLSPLHRSHQSACVSQDPMCCIRPGAEKGFQTHASNSPVTCAGEEEVGAVRVRGSGRISSSALVVTGSGTKFMQEFQPGDGIEISHPTS